MGCLHLPFRSLHTQMMIKPSGFLLVIEKDGCGEVRALMHIQTPGIRNISSASEFRVLRKRIAKDLMLVSSWGLKKLNRDLLRPLSPSGDRQHKRVIHDDCT